MRLSLCLILCLLLGNGALHAGPQSEERGADCVRMTVDASTISGLGGQVRQHYRIFFENLCSSVRVVYWCAEHPSKTLSATSVCSSRATLPGIAAPLYAVNRQREFQWTFPQGTLIRYVDCNDATYPTSDLRCMPQGQRPR